MFFENENESSIKLAVNEYDLFCYLGVTTPPTAIEPTKLYYLPVPLIITSKKFNKNGFIFFPRQIDLYICMYIKNICLFLLYYKDFFQ